MRASKTASGGCSCLFLAAVFIVVPASARGQATFSDDFERPDGPVDSWTVADGDWQISGGHLTTTASGPTESWIWAGTPPVAASGAGDLTLRAAVQFGPKPQDGVGRHGGLMFYALNPTDRGHSTGYTLDWIDRTDPPFSDYGFRLTRIDPGLGSAIQTPLYVGTPTIPDVPAEWLVEVQGDMIRLTADGNLVFEVSDATYREGHAGVWAYNNGTAISVDEFELDYPVKELEACFEQSALTGTAPIDVRFDASCTFSANGVAAYDWDFGDGGTDSGQVVSHTYSFGGSYMVVLTVRDAQGKTSTFSSTLDLFEGATSFSDDFERPDGPIDDWTVYEGLWNISGHELACAGADLEVWAWAGKPALSFPGNFTFSYQYRFTSTPNDGLGRHGGVMFCASKPTSRGEGSNTGYTVDWLDRAEDRGIRLLRIDTGGAQVGIGFAGHDLTEPPSSWKVIVDGDFIRVFGDEVQYLQVKDSTYRTGFIGVWAFANVQNVAIDDVEITSPDLSPCFGATPSLAEGIGTMLTFDAGCSSSITSPITEYHWDFGDGSTAEGPVVEYSYFTRGVRTVKLEVRNAAGLTAATERLVDIYFPLVDFEDDFNRADGPVEGWTVFQGDWSIRAGVLHNETPQRPEAWIFAGDPPGHVPEVASLEFDVSFLNARPADPDAVGRHGGVMFCAQFAAPRFQWNSGYTIDWIDREEDHGYRISIWNSGNQILLVPPIKDDEPGTTWRIEFVGETIRFLVDGVLKAEVADGSYRRGYFAFWAFGGDPGSGFLQQIDFENVRFSSSPAEQLAFHRGDTDDNGQLEITDVLRLLGYMFLGDVQPPCLDAADSDDNGALEITDALWTLAYMFLGGEPPPFPGPPTEPCGKDPGKSHLGCNSSTQCR